MNQFHFSPDKTISVRFVIALVLLVVVEVPTYAQGPDDHPGAPRPADSTTLLEPAEMGGEAFGVLAPQWGGNWIDGNPSHFIFTRFDAGYSPEQNAVYFMGGRKLDNSTDGSVWSLSIAGAYVDKGVDLITPVSNYTMNLLEDSYGMGFYIFCGRNSVGTPIDSVQVYYPDTNTVAQLNSADNYPGSGTCTAGLNAVYNNKVYVAGGLDTETAPYNWGETWVFDPLAAVGSRWTQITTANLSLPRAYMMSAVVDGKLYAIGGDWHDPTGMACGQSLCMEPIVEVLDLSAPVPTWDDTSAADLPEACTQGRAFGFDSHSPYIDADGTRFGGKIVTTCGGWSSESERVFVFDTHTNSWGDFPSLNRVRRNQAAEFVPLVPWGMGLMIMWGGRSGNDATILTIPESYVCIIPEYVYLPLVERGP